MNKWTLGDVLLILSLLFNLVLVPLAITKSNGMIEATQERDQCDDAFGRMLVELTEKRLAHENAYFGGVMIPHAR